MKIYLIALLMLGLGFAGCSTYSGKTKEIMNHTDLNSAARKFAETTGGSFRPATKEEIVVLRRLKMPESIVAFYAANCPPQGDLSGALGVRLLSVDQIVEENTTAMAPGCDVFPLGFIVFAICDGDAFCFDIQTPNDPRNPRIILFGHEEPLGGISRNGLLQDKAKIAARDFREFFQKAVAGTLDTEPKY